MHGSPEGGEGKEEGAATIDNRPSIEEYKGAGSGESKGGGVVGKKMRYTAFDELEREHIKRGEYVVDEGRVSKTGAAFISQVRGQRAKEWMSTSYLGDHNFDPIDRCTQICRNNSLEPPLHPCARCPRSYCRYL